MFRMRRWRGPADLPLQFCGPAGRRQRGQRAGLLRDFIGNRTEAAAAQFELVVLAHDQQRDNRGDRDDYRAYGRDQPAEQ